MIYYFVALLFVAFASWNDDYWWSPFCAALVVSAFLIAKYIYKKYHILVAILFFYLALNAIYVFAFNENHYSTYPERMNLLLKYYSCYGLVCILMLAFLVDRIKTEYLLKFFAFLCVINSLMVIWQTIFSKTVIERGGILHQGSMNSMFIGLSMLLLLHTRWYFLIPLPIIAIFCTKTSVPVGVLAVVIWSYTIFKHKAYMLGIVLFLIALSVGLTLDPQHFLSSSDRFEMYRLTWNEMLLRNNLWFGQGLSTFQFYGQAIQQLNNHMVDYIYVWLHNDILQLTFECGIIGLILFLYMAYSAIRINILKKQYIKLSCCLGYLAACMFNYPWHLALTAIFGLWLIKATFERE